MSRSSVRAQQKERLAIHDVSGATGAAIDCGLYHSHLIDLLEVDLHLDGARLQLAILQLYSRDRLSCRLDVIKLLKNRTLPPGSDVLLERSESWRKIRTCQKTDRILGPGLRSSDIRF